LRLNRRITDTKITCWMRSTSRRAKNSTTMSGICNHITNLAQECPHILKEIVHVAGNSARDCTDIAEYRQTRPPTSCNKNLGSRARSDCEARCSFGNVLSGEYPLNRLICRSQTSPPKSQRPRRDTYTRNMHNNMNPGQEIWQEMGRGACGARQTVSTCGRRRSIISRRV